MAKNTRQSVQMPFIFSRATLHENAVWWQRSFALIANIDNDDFAVIFKQSHANETG